MPAARSLRSAAAARLFSSLRALRSRTVRSRAALACVCCLWFAINAVLSVESRTALLGALSIGGPWRTRPVGRLRPALRGVSTRCRLSRKVPRDTLTLRFADARFRFLSRATRSIHGPSPPDGLRPGATRRECSGGRRELRVQERERTRDQIRFCPAQAGPHAAQAASRTGSRSFSMPSATSAGRGRGLMRPPAINAPRTSIPVSR